MNKIQKERNESGSFMNSAAISIHEKKKHCNIKLTVNEFCKIFTPFFLSDEKKKKTGKIFLFKFLFKLVLKCSIQKCRNGRTSKSFYCSNLILSEQV